MRFSLRHLQIFTAVAREGIFPPLRSTSPCRNRRPALPCSNSSDATTGPCSTGPASALRINETGRSLLPAARDLLDRAEEIDALLAGHRGPGSFRLGADPDHRQPYRAVAHRDLFPALSRQRPDAPDQQYGGDRGQDRRFLARPRTGRGRGADPDLIVTDWLDDELVLICNPSHPLAGQAPARSMRCSASAGSSGKRVRARARRSTMRCALVGAGGAIGMELQQIEAILETVAVSSMIGCVSRLTARSALAQGRVVQLSVPEDRPAAAFLQVVLHREKHVTTGIRAFMDISRCRSSPIPSTPSCHSLRRRK